MYVDDEPDMTDMLKMALEHAGFSVDIFNDPLIALERFEPNLYDLVILDDMMTKMNGIELHNQLKQIDPSTRVCFLTASNETYSEELGKERHCELNKALFMYMPLPISKIVEEINRRIK